MLTDNGFSHALAKEVLKDDPTNKAALKILKQPKNRGVLNGITYDADKVDIKDLHKKHATDFVKRVQHPSNTQKPFFVK